VIGDRQYGTIDNHRTMMQRGIRPHLRTQPGRQRNPDRFPTEAFTFEQSTDRFRCPAGQWLYPRVYDPQRQHTEYVARKGICAACPLHDQCTSSPNSRVLYRYREHDAVLAARADARSPEAWRDYRRRQHLMEMSFARSANWHGGKRSRWRRLWRQQIQDWLIAACLNLKLLVRALRPGPHAGFAGQALPSSIRKAVFLNLRFSPFPL
jgi:hypothetical protein